MKFSSPKIILASITLSFLMSALCPLLANDDPKREEGKIGRKPTIPLAAKKEGSTDDKGPPQRRQRTRFNSSSDWNLSSDNSKKD